MLKKVFSDRNNVINISIILVVLIVTSCILINKTIQENKYKRMLEQLVEQGIYELNDSCIYVAGQNAGWISYMVYDPPEGERERIELCNKLIKEYDMVNLVRQRLSENNGNNFNFVIYFYRATDKFPYGSNFDNWKDRDNRIMDLAPVLFVHIPWNVSSDNDILFEYFMP